MTPATVLFALLTLSALLLSVWFGVETWLLRTRRRPITWYTRRLVNEHQTLALTVVLGFVFVAGISVAHFYIDSPCQPAGS